MGSRLRAFRSAAAVIALGGSLVTVGAGSASAEPDGGLSYVALGDSSAAGPLILPQVDVPCLRSSRNWPAVAAAQLGAVLTDVTCSGATTADLAGRQFGFVPPQFDALTPDTDLVTLAIGANDIDLGTVVPSCVRLYPQTPGLSCRAQYTAGGQDRLAARIEQAAPDVAAVLARIHLRSPAAKVYVVSYGTYFKPGGCWPNDPIWPVDADYLQGTFDRLHAMLARQAAANGAGFIDLRTPSADHGVCASGGHKWLEGLLPTSAAAPYHPNATGMAKSGALVATAVGSR